MKHAILISVLLSGLGGYLTGQSQNLVVASSDVVGYPSKIPSHSYLLEADQDHFYRIAGTYNDAPIHPLLKDYQDTTGSIFFIQYNKQGEPIAANYLMGSSYPTRAFSFEGGLQMLGSSYNDVDANGQVLSLGNSDYLEYLASYTPDCKLKLIKNIWILPRSVYPNSDAALDSYTGSIYVYGSTSEDILEVDGLGPIGKKWLGSFLYVLKYNRDLQVEWAYTAGFNADTLTGYFPGGDLRLFPGANGKVLLTGTYYSNGTRPVFDGIDLPYVDNGQGVFAVGINGGGDQTWIQAGENQNWEYSARIEKGFSLSNGDYLLSGATSTGYFKLGKAEFTFEGGLGFQNQFVFRMGPDGNIRWSKPLATMVISGKKKATGDISHLKGAEDEDFNTELLSDALLWNEEVLYVTGTYQSPSLYIADKPLPVTFGEQFFVAAIDPANGRELWGYGFSSDYIELHGLDMDRTGHISVMGVSSEKQDYNSNNQVTGPVSRLIFHLGLDYRGKLLWYNNAFLQNQYFQIRGSDLLVLSNGEIFTSLQISATENLDIGEQTLLADFPYTNWLVGLKASMELSGVVKDETGLPVYPGYVRAYRSAPSRAFPVIDSVPLSDAGAYQFKELYPGNYTLQVVPDRDAFPESAPTYLGDRLRWTEAQFNDYGPRFNSSVLNVSIPVIPNLTPEQGSGTLIGKVSYEGALKSTLGRPVKKASVMLLKKSKKSTTASGDVLGYFETDDLGNYLFENVPDGEYILVVNITGLPMVQFHEVLIEGSKIVEGLDYEVGTDGIGISGGVSVKSTMLDKFVVFPNPGDGRIHLNFQSPGEYRLRAFGSDGKLVTSMSFRAVSGSRILDISQEDPGIYLIVLDGPEQSGSVKYVKQ